MKNIIILFSLFFIFACDDGDFDVPNFDFQGKAIKFCDTNNLIFYKINENETLILDTAINNTNNAFFKVERLDENITLTNKIYYKIYDSSIPNSFFCQNIPPTAPIVLTEWIGSGELKVNNTIVENENNTITYTTKFTLTNLTLTNNNDESINYETYDFETLTGTITN